MSIDRRRARDFAEAIVELAGKVNSELFYDSFRDKLIDLYATGQIDLGNAALRSYMREVMKAFDPKFANYVDRIYREYENTINLVNQFYKDIGPEISRDMKKIRAVESIQYKMLGEYKDASVHDIAKQVREAILGGESTDELIERLTSSVDEKVRAYADTLGHTLIGAVGQESKMEKARLGEVFYHEYIGRALRQTSHLFCQEIFGASKRTFHMQDIRKMRNGQIEPVERYRGGYNCAHRWEPDPFYDDKKHSVYFVDLSDGNRKITIGRHK